MTFQICSFFFFKLWYWGGGCTQLFKLYHCLHTWKLGLRFGTVDYHRQYYCCGLQGKRATLERAFHGAEQYEAWRTDSSQMYLLLRLEIQSSSNELAQNLTTLETMIFCFHSTGDILTATLNRAAVQCHHH